MHCFYCEERNVTEDTVRMEGTDVNHIKNVLRMRVGETLTVCDGTGIEYVCEISGYEDKTAVLHILEKKQAQTELPVHLVLYQGLPKKDKMELIIQKAVELGAAEIIPVMTKRCIVKLDEEKKELKKTERWQAIAESAAKQSGRAIIPKVGRVLSFKEALKKASEEGMALIPYELEEGMQPLKEAAERAVTQKTVSVFIGPEGGFEDAEVDMAKAHGVIPVSLGKRILRTETAGFTTLSILMYEIECGNRQREEAWKHI